MQWYVVQKSFNNNKYLKKCSVNQVIKVTSAIININIKLNHNQISTHKCMISKYINQYHIQANTFTQKQSTSLPYKRLYYIEFKK